VVAHVLAVVLLICLIRREPNSADHERRLLGPLDWFGDGDVLFSLEVFNRPPCSDIDSNVNDLDGKLAHVAKQDPDVHIEGLARGSLQIGIPLNPGRELINLGAIGHAAISDEDPYQQEQRDACEEIADGCEFLEPGRWGHWRHGSEG
jgi:hypothetical protein